MQTLPIEHSKIMKQNIREWKMKNFMIRFGPYREKILNMRTNMTNEKGNTTKQIKLQKNAKISEYYFT